MPTRIENGYAHVRAIEYSGAEQIHFTLPKYGIAQKPTTIRLTSSNPIFLMDQEGIVSTREIAHPGEIIERRNSYLSIPECEGGAHIKIQPEQTYYLMSLGAAKKMVGDSYQGANRGQWLRDINNILRGNGDEMRYDFNQMSSNTTLKITNKFLTALAGLSQTKTENAILLEQLLLNDEIGSESPILSNTSHLTLDGSVWGNLRTTSKQGSNVPHPTYFAGEDIHVELDPPLPVAMELPFTLEGVCSKLAGDLRYVKHQPSGRVLNQDHNTAIKLNPSTFTVERSFVTNVPVPATTKWSEIIPSPLSVKSAGVVAGITMLIGWPDISPGQPYYQQVSEATYHYIIKVASHWTLYTGIISALAAGGVIGERGLLWMKSFIGHRLAEGEVADAQLKVSFNGTQQWDNIIEKNELKL
tara:strand:+ start:1889 stop:3130 length:1242 start_codon:yes stop_codon:yes gene_type:complete